MASTGHISTHAKQVVQRWSITSGRPGAGSSARSGQVTMHMPHAVHDALMVTVFMVDSRVA